ncbi:hypothetical protein RirG_059040 [Rhizophagus irregularis DAOM 197198w]|nr:hypothetical protein RirG_059040 [Rhizophagus irregularis DAOM 197198w]
MVIKSDKTIYYRATTITTITNSSYCIYRNHAPRSHPYLNERPLISSRTPTIRYAAPTYRHTTEQPSSLDALHLQQTNVPAETTDFSSDIQDYEFW